MKECPNCGEANPPKARFCMFCNTQLVEENQLTEEDKLRIRNAELQEQLELHKRNKELLEKALADAQAKNTAPLASSIEETNSIEREITYDLDENFPGKSIPKEKTSYIRPVVEDIEEENWTEENEENHESTEMFAAPFSFKGRIRRLEYGISAIIFYVFYIIIFALFENNSGVFFLLLVPCYWFFLAQGAKRCHDRNNSGWFQIIPLYVLWVLFAEGDKGRNDYGNPPK